jgi:site-specific DNA recombinase
MVEISTTSRLRPTSAICFPPFNENHAFPDRKALLKFSTALPFRSYRTARGGTRVICTQYHNSKTCTNNRTFYLKQIEETVLSGLKVHLADPSAIRLFLETYYAERKRLIANANSIKPALERKIGELNRKIARLTEAMLESETPVTGFTAKLFELEDERRVTEAKLEELTAPQKAVALHPAARERYLQVVDDLAAAINVGKPAEEIVDAVRELIDSVVVEKTLPGEPIRLKVNGRLAALIGEPAFPEGSLSGVKMVAGERYRLSPHDPNLRYFLRSYA